MTFPILTDYKIAVTNANSILGDDRTIVQTFGHVMAGGADDFDSFLVSLQIRITSGKCR